MLGTLGRRTAEAAVVIFAVLGFAFVPLGSKSALEHLVALARSGAGRDAGAGLLSTYDRGRELVRRLATPDDAEPGAPLPLPSTSARVRPVPPELAPVHGETDEEPPARRDARRRDAQPDHR